MTTPFQKMDEDLPEKLRDGMFSDIGRVDWGSVVTAPGSCDSVCLILEFRDIFCCPLLASPIFTAVEDNAGLKADCLSGLFVLLCKHPHGYPIPPFIPPRPPPYLVRPSSSRHCDPRMTPARGLAE